MTTRFAVIALTRPWSSSRWSFPVVGDHITFVPISSFLRSLVVIWLPPPYSVVTMFSVLPTLTVLLRITSPVQLGATVRVKKSNSWSYLLTSRSLIHHPCHRMKIATQIAHLSETATCRGSRLVRAQPCSCSPREIDLKWLRLCRAACLSLFSVL